MSDNMRLVARVEDQFTGPLAKLKHDIGEVSDATRKHAGAWRKDWDGAREGVTKFQGALTSVTPVLSGLGVAGIGVGLSIGTAASALGEFSSKTRNLSQIGKDIGMTVDQLRAFQALGERFGMSADTMTGALKNMSSQMFDLNKQGTTFVQLQAMNLGKLAGILAKETNPQKFLEKAMEGIRDIPNNEIKRRVARLIFGTDDISIIVQNINGPIRDAFREVSASIGSMSKETEKAATDFQRNINRIGEAAESAKVKYIGPLLESMVGAIDYAEKHGLFGQDKNRPASQAPSSLDESLDAQMRGQKPLSQAEKDRQNRVDAIARDLAQKNGELDYARKRIVREPEVERRLTAEIQRLTDELRRLREQGATLSPSSFGGPAGGGSLIQKAAWGGFGGPLGGYGGDSNGSFAGPLGGGGGFGGSGPLGGGSGAGPLIGGGESASPGAGVPGGSPDAGSPRGNGSGNKRAARTGDMMAWAMDQLRREGVPEQHLRQAAAHLVGQAHMESGLDPNKVHDQGTGYGIYGARDPKGWGNYKGARRSGMVRWLEANGYARNSAEGQMRYMAREAMTDPTYRQTRRILMGQGTGDVEADTNAITKNFEAPFRINRRSPAVQNAYRVGPSDSSVRGDAAGPSGGDDVPWHQRPRSNEPGKMSRLRDDELEVPGSGERPGDRMMRRFYGEGAPVAKGGKGSLHITLEGFPAGSKAKASMDDLFRDTKVERGRSQMDMT